MSGTKIYLAQTVIVSSSGVVVVGSKITIKHGPLGELMPAMTMEFNVSDKKIISNFKRGDKVNFQVNKELELIKIESK